MMTITLYLTEVFILFNIFLMRAGDVVQLLFSLHGQIFIHGAGLLRPGRVLQCVDLLLGQVERPARASLLH